MEYNVNQVQTMLISNYQFDRERKVRIICILSNLFYSIHSSTISMYQYNFTPIKHKDKQSFSIKIFHSLISIKTSSR